MLNGWKPVIAIDIGSSAIKLVVMSRRRGRWTLHASKNGPTAGNAAGTLAMMLKTVPEALSKRKPTILVTVPCANVMVRRLLLPGQLSADQIDLAVRMEIEKDFPPDECPGLFIDYDVIPGHTSRLSSESTNIQAWLAAACSANVIQSVIDTLTSAGVAPAQIAVDVLVLDRFGDCAERGAAQYLYIDAGFSGIRLYALCNGVPGYIRSHSFGNNELACLGAPEFLLTLRRALQQYRLSEMLAQPSRVFVYGGRSGTPGLGDLVNQYCGCNAHILNPLSDWPIDDPGTDLSQIVTAEMAPAIALAMQEPRRW